MSQRWWLGGGAGDVVVRERDGDGDTALSCYAVPYEQHYNNYVGWFVYVPMAPRPGAC